MPCEDDLDTWATIHSDPSARYLGGLLTRTRSWSALAGTLGHWSIRGYGIFSLVLKKSNRCIGYVGPYFPEGWPDREIGWALRRDHWNQGLATEGLHAILRWARDEMKWPCVIHCIHPENAPSAALAMRVGSSFIGPTKLPLGPPFDALEYHLYGQRF